MCGNYTAYQKFSEECKNIYNACKSTFCYWSSGDTDQSWAVHVPHSWFHPCSILPTPKLIPDMTTLLSVYGMYWQRTRFHISIKFLREWLIYLTTKLCTVGWNCLWIVIEMHLAQKFDNYPKLQERNNTDSTLNYAKSTELKDLLQVYFCMFLAKPKDKPKYGYWKLPRAKCDTGRQKLVART